MEASVCGSQWVEDGQLNWLGYCFRDRRSFELKPLAEMMAIGIQMESDLPGAVVVMAISYDGIKCDPQGRLE